VYDREKETKWGRERPRPSDREIERQREIDR